MCTHLAASDVGMLTSKLLRIAWPPHRCRATVSDMTAAAHVQHIALSGELDPVGAPDVERQVRTAIDHGAEAIVLHLDEVSFVDSSGLRALLAATNAADEVGVDLRILPGPPQVMDVVEAAHLLGRLPFVGYP
jgi:anti-sigma B factor antagonist